MTEQQNPEGERVELDVNALVPRDLPPGAVVADHVILVPALTGAARADILATYPAGREWPGTGVADQINRWMQDIADRMRDIGP